MKGKRVVLVALLVLLASAQVAHGSGDSQALAVGKISWTRFSVCEHPLHPGLFLQYYLTDGCQRELFLHGTLPQGMMGSTIWAEGTLLENGGCKILDITTYNLCQAPSPVD
jgi:hypothetical protein